MIGFPSGEPLSVLIIEERDADAGLLVDALSKAGFDPQWERAGCESESITRLDPSFDIVLANFRSPELSVLESLQLLQTPGWDIPLIIVCDAADEDAALEMVRHGATDCVTTDRLTRLGVAVARALDERRLRFEKCSAQVALREKTRLLDLAHDAIIVRDTRHRVLFWNQGAEQLYGWSADEALGQDARTLVAGDVDDFETPTRDLMQKGAWTGEQRHRSKDGVKIAVESRWVLVRAAAGQPECILSLSTDITEEKQLEAQCLRAQRLDSIGSLASGVAHDLNNIIAPIMMCAPLLRSPMPPEKFEKLISTIETSASRGAEIVRQVLTFGRGQEGREAILPLGTLVQEIMKIAGETFPKSIQLQCSIAAGLWSVTGDATQFHQMLLNLCVNARDAMPDGGTLRIEGSNVEIDEDAAASMPEARPGTYAVLEVSDTGTGMRCEVIEKIFDPFFTTKDLGKGTGLGLSSVLSIVKNHRGFLTVRSAPGHGTTFKIYLPAEVWSASERKSERRVPALEGHGELILVVDDEANIRSVAQTLLEAHGYRTIVASEGKEGVALFKQRAREIALVLADVKMPFMDGLAMIRAIHKIDPGARVIASTGQVEPTRLGELDRLNSATFLQKPYGAETLLDAVASALRGLPCVIAPRRVEPTLP